MWTCVLKLVNRREIDSVNVIRVRVCPSTSTSTSIISPYSVWRCLISSHLIVSSFVNPSDSFPFLDFYFLQSSSWISRVDVFVNCDIFTTGKEFVLKIWFINLDGCCFCPSIKMWRMMMIITSKMSKCVRHSFVIRAGWDWAEEKKKRLLIRCWAGWTEKETLT